MKQLQAKSPKKIERLGRELPVQYVVFDILYHWGKPVVDRPLLERKALLDEVVKENDVFARIRFVEGNATGLFQVTGDAGLEGIVIKGKDAPFGFDRYGDRGCGLRSEEHTSELQSRENLVCRLLLEKKKRGDGAARR